MKIIGLILVVIGSVALANQGFGFVMGDQVIDARPMPTASNSDRPVWMPPVLGGISLVGGLIMLATGTGRRLA